VLQNATFKTLTKKAKEIVMCREGRTLLGVEREGKKREQGEGVGKRYHNNSGVREGATYRTMTSGEALRA